ncbi:hypothetical protein ACQZ6F_27590 [Rhizobium sp. A22-96]
MKPPWKFLAQLVSRRQSADKTDQTREGDNDRKPVEIELQPPSEPSPVSQTATLGGEHDHDSRSPDPVEMTASNPTEVEPPEPVSPIAEAKAPSVGALDEHPQLVTGMASLAPEGEVVEPFTKPRKTASKPTTKVPVNRAASHSATAGKEPTLQSLSVSTNPFFDEAANLDDDIKQLKDQLAQKLRLQNAQLRKMLERFDRS